MKKVFDVIGIGVPYMDILVQLDQVPKVNQSYPIGAWKIEGGGKVPTALVAASRLGLQTALITGLPDDVFGQMIQEELTQEGIDLSLSSNVSQSALSIVLADQKSNGRTILYSKSHIPECQFPNNWNGISAKLLHISAVEQTECIAIQWAKKEGIPIMIDADYYDPEFLQRASDIDLFIASEHFFNEYEPSLSLEEKLRQVFELGPSVVVVTLGGKGCWLFDSQGVKKVPAIEVEVVDTTGAGDVFHGAYIFGFLKGWNAYNTAQFASAVSAMKCRSLGGRAGIPNLNEVIHFLFNHRIDLTDFDKRRKEQT